MYVFLQSRHRLLSRRPIQRKISSARSKEWWQIVNLRDTDHDRLLSALSVLPPMLREGFARAFNHQRPSRCVANVLCKNDVTGLKVTRTPSPTIPRPPVVTTCQSITSQPCGASRLDEPEFYTGYCEHSSLSCLNGMCVPAPTTVTTC